MTKHRLLAAAAAGALFLGVAGCAADPADDLQTVSVDMADDSAVPAALAALDLGPSTSPSAGSSAGKDGLRHRIKVRLRKHMLHGEVTVQTKNGAQTVVIQRGTVTAKSGATLTVKSTDGFTLTWTTNADTKTKGTADNGANVALGGLKGDPQTARLIVVTKK